MSAMSPRSLRAPSPAYEVLGYCTVHGEYAATPRPDGDRRTCPHCAEICSRGPDAIVAGPRPVSTTPRKAPAMTLFASAVAFSALLIGAHWWLARTPLTHATRERL